jgi:hypothetical protein
MIKQLNWIWITNPNHPLYEETRLHPLLVYFRTNAGYEVYGRHMGYYTIKEVDAYPVAEHI